MQVNLNNLLLDSSSKNEKIKSRQFVTASARELELLKCFRAREHLLFNQKFIKNRTP